MLTVNCFLAILLLGSVEIKVIMFDPSSNGERMCSNSPVSVDDGEITAANVSCSPR